MSVDIIVVRGLGDKRGPDIVDPLLTSVPLAINRGTTEIQDKEPGTTVQLTTKYRTGVLKGSIVEVLDSLHNKVWRGKIVAIAHNSVLADLRTDLDIERL